MRNLSDWRGDFTFWKECILQRTTLTKQMTPFIHGRFFYSQRLLEHNKPRASSSSFNRLDGVLETQGHETKYRIGPRFGFPLRPC